MGKHRLEKRNDFPRVTQQVSGRARVSCAGCMGAGGSSWLWEAGEGRGEPPKLGAACTEARGTWEEEGVHLEGGVIRDSENDLFSPSFHLLPGA